MNQNDPVILGEMPVIESVIRNEVWLEGERRGCEVSPHDPVVRGHVCEVILRIGCELRESVTTQLADQQRKSATSQRVPPSHRLRIHPFP
jgi:hypothetical protein